MAATAAAAPELKRLAGVSACGRKLAKPVCHYSLSWARDEAPDRQEMNRAAAESLKALRLVKHQALIVAHSDGHPHVHVIVNRVDAESGKAAGLSKNKLRLAKWAEGYEQRQGRVRYSRRVTNNARRGAGGAGSGLGFNGAAPAGEDEPAPGASGSDRGGSDPTGEGGGGLAAGRGAHALGAVAAPAREEARGPGAPEQAGVGRAGQSALRGGAGDRARGGRSLPRWHGRVGGMGRGGGEDWVVGASIFTTVPLSITGNSGAPRSRCGWSRCGRSTESRLTKSGSGPGRGQASLWCPWRFPSHDKP